MIEYPYQIPFRGLGGESKLLLDYVSGEDTPIRGVLGGFHAGAARWRRRIEDYDRSSHTGAGTWAALVERLVEYNRGIGVSNDVVDRLRGARDGAVRFVVTGQQPGVLGGALLTLYKVVTATALAGEIERRFSTPCVPLFWMGADDADFREIRDLFLADRNLTVLSSSIEASAYRASAPVGDIAAAADGRVWESVEPIVAACPHGDFVSGVVEAALRGAADHGEATARLIASLASGRIAVVDGREPAVRTHARDLFLAFFDDEPRLKELVARAGDRLERAGYHAQLSLGPDSGVFLVEEGSRRKIPEARRAEARARMETDVTRFSPGVVLRNLVQDSVFRPVAVVLGPAEIAYRAQLDDVYRELGVGRPVVFPRLPATYLPPQVGALLDTVPHPDLTALLTDPARFVKRLRESQRAPEIDAAVERFRGAFRASADEFLSSIGERLDARAVDKTKKRVTDVERRLSQALDAAADAGASDALTRWPFLGGLSDFVRRNGKPQERYLSILAPFLFSGPEAGGAVHGAAAAFVDGALDGRASHVVYSSVQ